MHPIIEAAELRGMLGDAELRVIDTRDAAAYGAGHIAGAANVRDIFTYLSTSSAEGQEKLISTFSEVLGKAGVTRDSKIVVYEESMNSGFGQSCRGWFLLSYLGCPRVAVLNGGLKAWKEAGYATTEEVPVPEAVTFEARVVEELMPSSPTVHAKLGTSTVFLDVRDKDEWVGVSSSPYGVDFCPRKGRLPGAVWIEWYNFIDRTTETPKLKSPAAVNELMAQAGIGHDQEIIVYCFKGSRASVSLLTLKMAGFKCLSNYFASWNEWSRDHSLPIDDKVLE